MDLIPCVHLDYEDNYVDCEIKTCAPHYPDVRYWQRNNLPYPEAPTRVQFCGEGRGRINGIFDCYDGSMRCYKTLTALSNNNEIPKG